ncbi:MAG: PKD domain-containing protein [Chitinophagaceae bacterium]|nr:MAG: PKD domain-containing protein [Chitinophagaceae bacterium]
MDKRFLIVVAAVLVVVAGIFTYKMVGKKGKDQIGQVNFTLSHESASVNNEIEFEDKTPGATKWEWDFGDGEGPSFEQKARHSYTKEGVYTITLKVNGKATSTRTITITNPHTNLEAPAAAQISGPRTAYVGEKVTMSIPAANPKDIGWKFGENGVRLDVEGAATASYTYQSSGKYDVIATDQKTKIQSVWHIQVMNRPMASPASHVSSGGGGAGPARIMADNAFQARLQAIASEGNDKPAVFAGNYKLLSSLLCDPGNTEVTFSEGGMQKSKDFNSYCKHIAFIKPTILSVKQARDPQGCVSKITIIHN